MKMWKNTSLQFRIFMSMILLVVLAFITVASVTIMQYRKQGEIYHNERLLKKEEQIKNQLEHIVSQTYFPFELEYFFLIFKDDIHHIANVQNTNFNLYDLKGNLLISSNPTLNHFSFQERLSDSILTVLDASSEKRFVIQTQKGEKKMQSSYSYLNNSQSKPIAIFTIPDFENDSFNEIQLKSTLYNLAIIYLFWLALTIVVSYFISKYITKALKTIEKKLTKTQLLQQNEKIIIHNATTEINQLVTAYNAMVEQIEKSKNELAKNEREKAWREMAKQIAHEIKNPLTPMRLMVQNFERRFTENTPKEKISDFCKSLIQQIDTLTEITSAFSSFTTMPEHQKQPTEINELIKRVVEIFDKKYIVFHFEVTQIIAYVDKNQINRVITNLLKNALQATENTPFPFVEILLKTENKQVCILVKDNGVGIPSALHSQIFEPKFTTKTTGSGLGLAIVKSIIQAHNGTISLYSEPNKGTTFEVKIPLENF